MDEPVLPVPVKIMAVTLAAGTKVELLQKIADRHVAYLKELRDEVTLLRSSAATMEETLRDWQSATGHETPASFREMRDEILDSGMFSEILEAAPAPENPDEPPPDPYLEYGMYQ